MPGVIELPSVPVTGPLAAGAAIQQGTQDYMRLKLQQDAEARQRAQQLQDVQDARTYAEQQNTKQRAQRLQDVEAEKLFSIKSELARLGYLDTADFDNSTAVSKAISEARKDRLVDKYRDAINRGTMSWGDLGDPVKMSAALERDSTFLANETNKRQAREDAIRANREDVRTRQTQIANQLSSLQKQAKDLDAQLNAPIPAPTQRQIDAVAFPQGDQAKLKPEEIAARREAAKTNLEDFAQKQWYEMKQSAMVRRQLLASQMSDLTRMSDTLSAKTGIVGIATEPDQTEAPAQTPPQAVADPSGGDFFSKMVAAAKARQAAAAPATNPAANPDLAPLPAPGAPSTALPVIQAENARRAALAGQATQSVAGRAQQLLSDPYNESLDKIAYLQKTIAALADPNYTAKNPLMAGQGQSHVGFTPQQRAEDLSQALTELAATKQQLEQQRRAMLHLQDPTVAASTSSVSPPVSNAVGTTPWSGMTATPAWWSTPAAVASGTQPAMSY